MLYFKRYKPSYGQIVQTACVLPNRPRELGALFNRDDAAAGLKEWQKAMDGDIDFYADFIPNDMREAVLLAAVFSKMPRPSFREMVEQVWTNKRHLPMTQEGARKIFEYAEFNVSHLPERVTLYRGAVVKPTIARRGISWTLDREVAAWFATRGGKPVLLKAEMPRSSIVAFFEDSEQECVVFGVRGSRVDLMPDVQLRHFTGATSDVSQAWQEASDRYILRVGSGIGGWEEANARSQAREKLLLAA